ncbi:MAG: hypothetical protein Q4B45_09465 [Coriobacteriia bacterium]|nr:hypothetical protein [Coriobacteriia bacterium]
MMLELKRFAKSGYLAVAFGLTVLFIVGGYGWQMPAHPDGVGYATCFEGAYTVYCQFGQLILSAFAMHYVTGDFAKNHVLFYGELGIGSPGFYLRKVGVMAASLVAAYAFCSLVVCALYGDFTLWAGMLLQISALIAAYLSVFCCVSQLIGKFVNAYFIYLVWWLGASVAVAGNTSLAPLIQHFDQNGDLYSETIRHMQDAGSFLANQGQAIAGCFVYAAALLAVGTLISLCARRRFLSNGVQ